MSSPRAHSLSQKHGRLLGQLRNVSIFHWEPTVYEYLKVEVIIDFTIIPICHIKSENHKAAPKISGVT